MNIKDDVSRLCLNVASLTRSNQRLEKTVTDQNEILSRVVKVLEIKFDKKATKAVLPPIREVMFFSDIMKRWRKDSSLQEKFVRYFTDQCFEGYELEKNSGEFKRKLPSEKNKIKTGYKRLKKAIKVMLYFCDRFPPPPPENPSSLVKWQRDLSLLAEEAMSAMIEEIPQPPNRITPFYLQKSEIVKDWDNPDSPLAKSLPKDTPNAILIHFGYDS
jgi:hypothetical protein